MPKLQRIKRANGSLVYSVNIPLEIIEELEWEKGTQLDLETKELKEGFGIIISKGDNLNEEEEKLNDIKV